MSETLCSAFLIEGNSDCTNSTILSEELSDSTLVSSESEVSDEDGV